MISNAINKYHINTAYMVLAHTELALVHPVVPASNRLFFSIKLI